MNNGHDTKMTFENCSFVGFYESALDNDNTALLNEDMFFEQYNNKSREIIINAFEKMGKAWWEYVDLQEYQKRASEEWTYGYLGLAEKGLGKGIKLLGFDINSPKEYNFSTDHLTTDIELPCTIKEVFDLVNGKYKDLYAKVLEDKYTSRSGFIPFYPSEIVAFNNKCYNEKGELELDSIQAYTLIEVLVLAGLEIEGLANNEDLDDSRIEMENYCNDGVEALEVFYFNYNSFTEDLKAILKLDESNGKFDVNELDLWYEPTNKKGWLVREDTRTGKLL